jgi:2',3'-cyclic-nucleotide 2'-phosphodiesterase
VKILCIGDVVGKPGRRAVLALLPRLIDEREIDVVIANGENAAGGLGLTRDTAMELLNNRVDLLTGGNHIWKYKDLLPLLEADPRVLRPLNYPDAPGRGSGVIETAAGHRLGVINVVGRSFMDPAPCPFDACERAVEELKASTQVVLVEIHAEATSEKRAMGWLLDGQASAVYGTHTHVATADEEILPGGTGYITDIGMTGPYDSVIGMRKEEMIARFRSLRPAPFIVAKGDVRLCGVIFDVDPESGKTRSIERVREPWAPQ